jgi:hypothetical protein
MPRVSHFSRQQIWVERLNRFSVSRQTVAAFCAAERCSIASFYQWRRKLKSTRPAAFAELSVVAASLTPASPVAASVHLPNGVRIELGSDEAMAKTIIAQVLKHDLRHSTAIANNRKAASC